MLVDALLNANRRSPGKLAVSDGIHALTYKRLTALARVLRGVVLNETDCPRVGIMLPASAMFPATLFGTLWASRTAIPLNFLLGPDELAGVVADAGIDLILTVRPFQDACGKLPVKIRYLEELPLKRKLLLSMLLPRPAAPQVDPNDTAVILYTSGTTAEPKGVELTYGNLHGNATDAIFSLNMDAEQIMLNNLPPFHVFGLTGNVLVPTILGATVHAIPRFSPVGVVRTVAEKGITVMLAIPSMYAAVLKTKSAKAEDFRSVRLAVSGGEPLSDSVRLGFQDRFGVTLRQGYGLTETSPVVAACSVEASRDGTVGKPIRHVELRLVDAEGREVAPGQDGEIFVRGPGVMKGYYNKPEETAKVLDADGWFCTGDIGRIDDGFLSITGRAKEMLIIGGENVFPREIEAVLETCEGVLQCAVIGMPDDMRGEVPVAFVLPQHGATVDEQALRSRAKDSLAGFKVPRRVVIRENLPTGPTGKILKRRLKELL